MNTPDLTSPSEPAENTPSVKSNATEIVGKDLLASVVAAHGGETFLSIHSLTISGTGQFFTPPQIGRLKVALDSFTLYSAPGGRSRLEAKSVFGALVILTRGTGKGGFVVMGGRKQELPEEHMSGMEPMEFLRTAFVNNYPVTTVPEMVDEKTQGKVSELCYEVQSPSGEVTHLFVDARTKLMRKLVSNRSRGEMTVLLADCRAIEGTKIPGELRLLENGAEIFHLFSKEITINHPLNDKLFEMP